ncbi:MAG: hypothetical protein V4543_14535 [Bacteroidota bacterium]
MVLFSNALVNAQGRNINQDSVLNLSPQNRVPGLSVLKTIPLSNITRVSLDRQDRFIVCTEKGLVTRFDSNGNAGNLYSPRRPADVTLAEAWNGLRIFLFYRDLQEYVYLDRFLTESPNSPVPQDIVGYARMAAPAQDDNLWVIDEADFSLKKIDPVAGSVLLSTRLAPVLQSPKNADFSFMREYQNRLYIAERNTGIIVFDNMGNMQRRLPLKDVGFFSFSGDEMVFTKGSEISFINIYTLAERNISLPADIKAQRVLVSGKSAAVFTDTAMLICELLK